MDGDFWEVSKKIISYSFKNITYGTILLALRTKMISLRIKNTCSKDEKNNGTSIIVISIK